ncbi:MAG TPA: sulfatase-like hydrolase/transferase [Deltaproteobacteria bacterium]|nr:sulfatase-like hydrolase/transferase [Deltaproteobacteria bacterium]
MNLERESPPGSSRASGAVLWYVVFNFAVSLCLCYAYILFTPDMDTPLSRVFVHGALVSNTAMLYLVLSLVFGALSLAPGVGVGLLWFMTGFFTVLHMLTVLDIIVFRIFRYHINSMVITLVFTEGARDSLHIGTLTVLTYAAASACVLVLEIWLARLSRRIPSAKPSARRALVFILAFALLFVTAEKATYAFADLFGVKEVTRYNRVFPLYQRLTVKRLARKYLGVKTDPEFKLSASGRTLKYPAQPLVRDPSRGGKLYNIVWIVIDAWRFDMLNAEVTPNILKFSESSLVFANHRSGGNATRFGIFTLFYGLYGTYWHPFLAEGQPPVFLDELMKLGYDFRIISSSSLSNPEFRRTVFVKLGPYITDHLDGVKADERDPELARTFVDWLNKRDKSRPFFSFLFFDAPHGPYSYPDTFEKFRPSNKNPNYVTAGRKDAHALFNSYKNAVFFDDHLTGMILDALERRGLMEDTIVLITGDHGEEFYETGYWGHTSTFSVYQTGVSFVLYIPGMPHGVIRYPTSHLDVVPTFMRILGYRTPPAAYSHGEDLLGKRPRKYAVVSGWDEAALADEVYTIVMPTQSHVAAGPEVRLTRGWRLADDERDVLRRRQADILTVMMEMGAFLK